LPGVQVRRPTYHRTETIQSLPGRSLGQNAPPGQHHQQVGRRQEQDTLRRQQGQEAPVVTDCNRVFLPLGEKVKDANLTGAQARLRLPTLFSRDDGNRPSYDALNGFCIQMKPSLAPGDNLVVDSLGYRTGKRAYHVCQHPAAVKLDHCVGIHEQVHHKMLLQYYTFDNERDGLNH